MVQNSLGKMVEKPRYGGNLVYALYELLDNPDETKGHGTRSRSLHITNEEMFGANWLAGPSGTGDMGWITTGPTVDPGLILCEDYEIKDPETIIFKIRKGIHFHNKPPTNGREMTADDYVYTALRNMTSRRNNLGLHIGPRMEGGGIDPPAVRALDKYTVEAKSPPGFLGLALQFYGDYARVIPHEVIEEYGDMQKWEASCGTGPFMWVDYVPGSSARFEKNPNYWMNDPLHPENRLPYVDSVTWLFILEPATRKAALRTGKIDQLEGATWEEGEELIKTAPDLKSRKYVSGWALLIFMRTDKPELPFHDIRVRQAMHMAVDHDAIIEDYFGGNADKLGWPVSNTADFKEVYIPLEEMPETVQELFTYKPEKAKQLLAEAGYPDGFEAECLVYEQYLDLVSIYKYYWDAIGIDVKLDTREYSVYRSITSGRKHNEMSIRTKSTGQSLRMLCVDPIASQNLSMVDEPYTNETREAIAANYFLDIPKMSKTYKEWLPYFFEQAWIIQTPLPHEYVMWNPWLKGYSGEVTNGNSNQEVWTQYTWLDQALKESMVGKK
ncbi:ABC transporter substrate-binding protein [Chloroflexota bacterium]